MKITSRFSIAPRLAVAVLLYASISADVFAQTEVRNGDFLPGRIGIGALTFYRDKDDERGICTATEIKDRCLLTAAHCVEQPPVSGSRFARYYFQAPDISKSEVPGITRTLYHIPEFRSKKNPLYNPSAPTKRRIAQADIALVWTSPVACFKSGTPNKKNLCNLLQPQRLYSVSFLPRRLNNYFIVPNEMKVDFIGYGQNSTTSDSGKRRIGTTQLRENDPVYIGGSHDLYPQVGRSGDSGGPMLSAGTVYGVTSMGHSNSTTLGQFAAWFEARTTFAKLAHPDNSNFVDIKSGEAAKFCRVKVPVHTAPMTDSVYTLSHNWQAGSVDMSLIDPLKEFSPELGNCNSAPGSLCSLSSSIEVNLDARPSEGYQFAYWTDPSQPFPHLPSSCPCEESSNPSCAFDHTAVPYSAELLDGVYCAAVFVETAGPFQPEFQ